MKESYTGYVLNSIDYKDNDSLVSVLCQDGLVCLRARGVKKEAVSNATLKHLGQSLFWGSRQKVSFVFRLITASEHAKGNRYQ